MRVLPLRVFVMAHAAAAAALEPEEGTQDRYPQGAA
jgi:hypothetical protein